ncbi:MAG: 50S ribosomal protein L17 [bacterium]
MRHMKAGKKLGRTGSHRRAMFRNIVTSLLQSERIVTTEGKAKEAGRLAEKMITLGKRGDLHARRQAVSFIKSNEVVKKVFSELAERYRTREGGYTRVLKLEPRAGDNAPMAIVELVDRPMAAQPEKESKARKKEIKAKASTKAAAKKAAPKKAAEKKEAEKETSKKAVEEKEKVPKKKAKTAPRKKKEAAAKEEKAAKKETPKKDTGKKVTGKKKARESEDKS